MGPIGNSNCSKGGINIDPCNGHEINGFPKETFCPTHTFARAVGLGTCPNWLVACRIFETHAKLRHRLVDEQVSIFTI